jgi:predicted flap endonuclease-1-like 5' DNA nuclease
MARIIDVEGIGPKYAAKLQEYGIFTTERLLMVAAHRQGRKDLAEETVIPEKLILEWVNLADLMRVKGIGEEYSDLLEEAGVDSVKELSKRAPDPLYSAIVEVNESKLLVRRLPSRKQVRGWIGQAKKLTPVVSH